MGGWPHSAPLGYTNVRETISGRQVAHIVTDPERAPHITAAFSLYATGEWTLERLVAELDHRGLRNRGRRDRAVQAIGVSALANILSNKAYAGIVSWEGIEYPGLHQPLTDTATFNKVQDLLAARAARGTRERRHNHYLKGTLFCGVCGRGLSFQLAKGRYEYLYCLGQKNRNPTGCQEPYMPAGDLEAQVEQLYERIQLPKSWLKRLREELEAEITARQHRNAAEREFLTRKLAKADTERHKLLDAYYAGAIDVITLKTEQTRIAADVRSAEERLAAVDAHLAEWQGILEAAMRFATNCAKAYARASAPTRRRFNQAVFTRIDVRDGKIAAVGYHPPFDLLFSSSEFEYGDLVVLPCHSTRPSSTAPSHAFTQVDGPVLCLPPLGTVLRQSPGEPPVHPTDPLVASLAVQRRLVPDEVAELVAAYRRGVSVDALAASFRVNRTTVLGHVRRHGVPKRDRRALQGDEVDRAAQLYAGGQSADWVAAQLGVAASTVRRALKDAGMTLRPAGRRRRSA